MNQSLHPLGKITKMIGYGGALLLISDEPMSDEAESLSEVFVEVDGLPVPFPVEELSLQTDTSARLKLEFINNPKEASVLVGCRAYAEFLPVKEDSAEAEQLIGFSVYDSVRGYIGAVRQIENYNGNIVLQITDGEKETLISFFPGLISKIDDKAKTLYITAPDGYFD